MPYEVTKLIAGRAYRYRVESFRDEATGKRRNRWTYLGRVEQSAAHGAAPRKRRGDARRRLLDALERLLAERDFAAVTADAIAAEAHLAHGTFYRHFRDKRAALLAALERVREERGTPLSSLRDDVTTREAARAGLRAMVEGVLRAPAERPALLRAYFALAMRDEELGRERRERKRAASRRIAEHLRALRERGLAAVDDADATAAALFAMIDGFYQEAIVEATPLDQARIAAAVAVTERAVFGEIPRKEEA